MPQIQSVQTNGNSLPAKMQGRGNGLLADSRRGHRGFAFLREKSEGDPLLDEM